MMNSTKNTTHPQPNKPALDQKAQLPKREDDKKTDKIRRQDPVKQPHTTFSHSEMGS